MATSCQPILSLTTSPDTILMPLARHATDLQCAVSSDSRPSTTALLSGDVLLYIIDPNLKMLGFHAYSPEPIKKHEAKNRHTKPGHGMPVRREVVRLKFPPLWLGLGLANPNPNPSPNPNPAHAR